VGNVGEVGAGQRATPVRVPGGSVVIVALGRPRWVKFGISWSADHRVVEGAELASFMKLWWGYVGRPERMIAEGI
jgi:2-oxoisovalerate dehydrogenase E2 component (dihydrolipoyl transacylase)